MAYLDVINPLEPVEKVINTVCDHWVPVVLAIAALIAVTVILIIKRRKDG